MNAELTKRFAMAQKRAQKRIANKESAKNTPDAIARENERIMAIVQRVQGTNEDSRNAELQRDMKRDEKLQKRAKNASKKQLLVATKALGYAEIQVPVHMSVNDMKRKRAIESNLSYLRKNNLLPDNKPVPVTEKKCSIPVVKPQNIANRSKWMFGCTYDSQKIDLYDCACPNCSSKYNRPIKRSDCGHDNFNFKGLTDALKLSGIPITDKQQTTLKKNLGKAKKSGSGSKTSLTIDGKKLVLQLHKVSG